MASPPQLYSVPGFTDPVSSIDHLLGAGLFSFLGACFCCVAALERGATAAS